MLYVFWVSARSGLEKIVYFYICFDLYQLIWPLKHHPPTNQILFLISFLCTSVRLIWSPYLLDLPPGPQDAIAANEGFVGDSRWGDKVSHPRARCK